MHKFKIFIHLYRSNVNLKKQYPWYIPFFKLTYSCFYPTTQQNSYIIYFYVMSFVVYYFKELALTRRSLFY